MWQDGLKQLSEQISYLEESDNPLSADVFFIRTDACVYVYDVGSCVEARERIERIHEDKIVVLSHFHADHTDNLGKITFRELYAGKETLKHVGAGNAVEGEVLLEPLIPIRLITLPSSHAKDCVALCYGNQYAFCGDATYATQKRFPAQASGGVYPDSTAGEPAVCTGTETQAVPDGEKGAGREPEYTVKTVYNAQKLKAMIETLKSLDVKYLVLSHEGNPVHCKSEVIRTLELIYRRRDKNSAYIVL